MQVLQPQLRRRFFRAHNEKQPPPDAIAFAQILWKQRETEAASEEEVHEDDSDFESASIGSP